MKIFNMMIAAAAIILLGSCSTDDSLSKTDTETGRTMKISVAQAGFTGSDSTGTRATNADLTTTFESGDHVGIYVTDGSGKVVTANQEITYDGTNWIIGDATTGTEATLEYHSAYHYFAYYPYNSKAPTDLTLTATTGENFFGSYINNFTPSTDQSTAADYSAQDLMVATGAVDGTSLSFGMTHQMALVEVDFAQEKWTYYGGPYIYKYAFDTYSPYNISNGAYRILVKPATAYTINGNKYNKRGTSTGTWSLTTGTTLTAGKYKHYKSNGKSANLTSSFVSPEVGDIYYSDGMYCSTIVSGKTPIGVVVSTNGTNGTYCESGKGYGHGLVMALKDAGKVKWETSGTDAGLTKCSTYKALYHDVSGLSNQTNKVSDTYPAFKAAYNYLSAAHPTGSSSWFLPSAGQWWDAMENAYDANDESGSSLTIASYHDDVENKPISGVPGDYKALAALNKLMSKYSGLTYTAIVDGGYWTGSEWNASFACDLYFSSSSGLTFGYSLKTVTYYVRPFLAF